MNKSYKKILSLSFGCFISVASYAAAPLPFGAPFGAAAQAPVRKWTPLENQRLAELVAQHGTNNWKQIASSMPGRNVEQCQAHWHQILAPALEHLNWTSDQHFPEIGHRRWTLEEDQQLAALVEQHGINWKQIAPSMPGRSNRQCRDRWINYLNPTPTNNPWTQEEEAFLLKKYQELGPKWTLIATFFTGRTDMNCKNRWHTIQSRTSKARRQRRQPIPAQLPQPLPQVQPTQFNLDDLMPLPQPTQFNLDDSMLLSPPPLPQQDDFDFDFFSPFKIDDSLFSNDDFKAPGQ
jgi:hypothetical protein